MEGWDNGASLYPDRYGTMGSEWSLDSLWGSVTESVSASASKIGDSLESSATKAFQTGVTSLEAKVESSITDMLNKALGVKPPSVPAQPTSYTIQMPSIAGVGGGQVNLNKNYLLYGGVAFGGILLLGLTFAAFGRRRA